MSSAAIRKLPVEITSYDLVKCAAVFFMIIDHIGVYFYPDAPWWRVVGRIDCAFWFFLIGYANTREIPTKMWVGAVALLIADAFLGMALLPLNILFVMMLLRIVIDPVMKFAMQSGGKFWLTAVLLALFLLPTYVVIEYGTGAVLMTMFGYLVRRRKKINKDGMIIGFAVFTVCIYAITQKLVCDFSTLQFFVVLLGTFGVIAILSNFKPEPYPEATRKLPRSLTWLVQFGGRRTLEIYVVHVLLFKIVATMLGIEGHAFLDFKII